MLYYLTNSNKYFKKLYICNICGVVKESIYLIYISRVIDIIEIYNQRYFISMYKF